MERCVDALGIRPGQDDVLEIGFGCAYSANRIQTKRPRSHTIIECDPQVLERAKAWAAAKTETKIIIVAGMWQDMLSDLGVFDVIFFDDFPVPESADIPSSSEGKQGSVPDDNGGSSGGEGSAATPSRWLTFWKLNWCIPT